MTSIGIRTCPNCGGARTRVKYLEPPFQVVKCRACALVYLGNPPDSDAIYENYYDGEVPDAEEYRRDSRFAHLAELHALNAQRLAFIKRFKTAGKLLDVGCGRGYFLKTAQQHGFEVSGIDVSTRAVEYAKNNFGINAEAMNLHEIEESPATFEIVTLWHALEHFLDPLAALRKIRSLLKDGGVCFIEVPNLRSAKFLLAKRKWSGGNHPLYHRTFFTAKTLTRMLQQSGYSRVQRVKISHHVPGKSAFYQLGKRLLNEVAMDAFLDFVAWK